MSAMNFRLKSKGVSSLSQAVWQWHMKNLQGGLLDPPPPATATINNNNNRIKAQTKSIKSIFCRYR